MKLTGIIEDVFRGVTIFRGYATLKTLASLSTSTSYQRDKDPDRVNAIMDYISNSSYVFYPELILGWQLDNADAIRIIKEEENTSSISLGNGIKIRKAKFKFKSLSAGEEPKTKVVTIEIPNTFNDKIFNRIDGNHRLSVVDKIKDETGTYDSEICNQIAPFSLIIQSKSHEANKYESAYFYLINSKAKALTTEENLKAIFKADRFTQNEKKELLSIESDFVIDAIGKSADKLSQSNLRVVDKVFDGCVYSLSYNICREFDNPNIEAILSAISYINDEYYQCESTDFTSSYVYALIKVRVANRNLFECFIEWAHSHHLENKDGISSKTLWTMFDTIIKSAIEVFVAMPYYDGKPEIIEEYNKIYSDVITDIAKEKKINISLFPIMCNKGATGDQIQDIIDKIKKAKIVFADITDNNPNVFYELGWARALDKKVVIVKRRNGVPTKSDIQNDIWHEYDDSCRSVSLGKIVKDNIIEILNNYALISE